MLINSFYLHKLFLFSFKDNINGFKSMEKSFFGFWPMPEIESKMEILIFFRLAALFALIANRCASSLALISKLKRFEFLLIDSCPSIE